MRNIFFTLLFLLVGFSGKAQTPTLIYSASFTASSSGASRVPTVNVNIPAGNNRVMFARYYMERNHGTTTPNSN